jgi:hypothetical protein
MADETARGDRPSKRMTTYPGRLEGRPPRRAAEALCHIFGRHPWQACRTQAVVAGGDLEPADWVHLEVYLRSAFVRGSQVWVLTDDTFSG